MSKTTTRFIASVIKTSEQEMPPLPFQRGARRAAFIAKRAKETEIRKSA